MELEKPGSQTSDYTSRLKQSQQYLTGTTTEMYLGYKIESPVINPGLILEINAPMVT